MKILLVSMNSIHFQRWTSQLKDSGHEIYWFDIRDGSYSGKLSWVNQIVGWKQRFPKLKGRHFIKKKTPWFYKQLRVLIEHNTAEVFEKVLKDLQPDVVHSFALYVSCAPILSVMKRHHQLKWVYSSWGSDLFYFQNNPKYLKDIQAVLPRVNYLFADCKRDVTLAKKHGFNGEVLGVFPGGGGYPLCELDKYITPISERHIILVKGYQGRSGRAIAVLKAIETSAKDLSNFKIIVFGADDEVNRFITDRQLKDKCRLEVYNKSTFLPHLEVIKLMGKALIYIGNSNSDGMPNTLLEAVIMGAFPIQSNPGGASEEVVRDYENGLLITDCNNSEEIKEHIDYVLAHSELIHNAFFINQNIKKQFDSVFIKEKVLEVYKKLKA